MADVLGVCPVSEYMKFDGLNGGLGAGRACWMVPHGADAAERRIAACSCRCYTCEFYKSVVFEQEENTRFKFTSIDA